MMIPGAEGAVVPLEKLVDYVLNKDHIHGRHKALVFESALGITIEDAEWLRDVLINIVRTHNAVELTTDRFGTRYRVDFRLTTAKGTALIRSGWIVERGQRFPKLTTCMVIGK
ncbi:MAG: DUF6883 domain-containing protein [Anaerolineae bacterium]|jgi:hypothetical protein